MEKITVAITSFTPNMLDLLLAKEKGFYADEGLDVEWAPLAGEKGARALLDGQVDLAIQVAAALKLVLAEGARLKVVLVIHRDPPHWIMARPGVSGVLELKGKSVGSGARGSDSSILVEGWLEQNGLRAGTDVRVTYHPAQPDWARGWIRMTDDAPMAIPLEREMLEAKGWRPLVNLTTVFPGLLIHGFVAAEAAIAKRPETIRRVIRAHRNVVRYLREVPDEVIAYIQRRWEVDREVAAGCYDYLVPAFIAELEPRHLQPVVAAAAKELGKDCPVPEAVMEPRMLREAIAS